MNSQPSVIAPACEADAERRFGGLARLYGPDAPAALRRAHVAVAGLGGVGSWTAEALARCGVGALTLIDLDHIAESNVNRQIHALSDTLGQAKIEAMAQRIGQINPACAVTRVDEFVAPDNVMQVLGGPYAAIVDCTDQAAAKIAMILHARQRGVPLLLCGGAGGKTDPLALRAGDLSEAVNDALLAKLRNKLRREHGFPGPRTPTARSANGCRAWACVPCGSTSPPSCPTPGPAPSRARTIWARPGPARPQGLSCAGYGSVVTVTAAMGLAAANEVLRWVVGKPGA